ANTPMPQHDEAEPPPPPPPPPITTSFDLWDPFGEPGELRAAADAWDEVVGLVAETSGLSPDVLVVASIDGFPHFFYVTLRDAAGEPLVGGDAFVVETETGAVHRVSASLPPRVNCRNIERRGADGLDQA
ncbi:MAG: hypothetical protein KY439_02995, partial [Actinobacteria bacterium]|nr:hypothetical protein [Actinomycetota bacterium]